MRSIIVEKRRKRSINFTESDRHILLELVKPHLSVIENKRTDKFTSKLKAETWENIRVQYNKMSTQPRTALQLKLFYEANKYKTKKKEATSVLSDECESPAKIVKIEVETSSIMNILAKNDKPKTDESNTQSHIAVQSNERIENAKIKVVDISKLRSPASSSSENAPTVTPPPTLDTMNIDQFTKGSGLQSTFLSNALYPTATQSMQEEIHKMRMLILQDERHFRRQEHLKRLEFIDLNILALKSNILRQNS